VIRLEKCHVPVIVNLLVQPRNPFGPENPRWKAVFGDAEATEKHIDSMKWFVTALTNYWIKKQEIWGFVNRNLDNRLEAVVFWEPPEHQEASIRWLLMKERAKGFFKMGPRAYGHLVDKFNAAKNLRHKHTPNEKGASVIHYFAINNDLLDHEAEVAAMELVRAVSDYSSEPTYAILSDINSASQFLEQAGFERLFQEEDLTAWQHKSPGKYSSSQSTSLSAEQKSHQSHQSTTLPQKQSLDNNSQQARESLMA